ncbi:MAG TPA: hypothetical protein VI895_01910 [Bdellovibrionota bacterium]|nr:hypothetical protein [Bdellovibrionota bacterium]
MDFLNWRYALLFLIVFGLLPTKTFAEFNLISPGPLAQPHAFVEGEGNCLKCHQEGKQVVGGECLTCHTELQERIRQTKGYHGRLDQVADRCGKCHPDHAGRTFKLIHWEKGKENFSHEDTGYSLRGGHAKVPCAGCHDIRRIKDSIVREILAKNPGKETYLGLTTACASCHFDEHRGQLSATCESCHDENEWKKAQKFNHRTTRFPLVGKHRPVPCEKCHPWQKDTTTPAKSFPTPLRKQFLELNGMPFSSCESCHRDVHEGKFGKTCETCHTPNDWHELINKKVKGREFHEKTRFPLRGAHASVECRSCHGPFGKTPAKFKGLKFERCSDCHIDAHVGQLTAALWKDCSDCHNVNSFLPVEFDLPDHMRTRYPLEGGHRAIACPLCHAQKKELARMVPETAKRSLKNQGRPLKVSLALFHYTKSLQVCETCHVDPHKGQFFQTNPVKRCDQCHQVTSFKELRFDHNRDSRYPLTGKHAKIACAGCHPSEKQGARYRPIAFACETCHRDVHLGQFKAQTSSAGVCERCHTTEDFKKKLLFDHNDKRFTTFALEGKHSSVKCEKCHFSVTVATNVRAVKYKPFPRICEGCHVDPHKGAFKDFLP